MSNAKFSESHDIICSIIPLADNYNAGMSGDSINMAKYDHGCLIIAGSASVAGAGVLTMMAGAANASETAAITFTYRYTASDIASTTADVLSTPATSASLTFTEANILSGMYIIEWDASDLNVSGTQYQWITPVLSAAGTAGIICGIVILSKPRYELGIMPTAIA
jgi:hypothetical protein